MSTGSTLGDGNRDQFSAAVRVRKGGPPIGAAVGGFRPAPAERHGCHGKDRERRARQEPRWIETRSFMPWTITTRRSGRRWRSSPPDRGVKTPTVTIGSVALASPRGTRCASRAEVLEREVHGAGRLVQTHGHPKFCSISWGFVGAPAWRSSCPPRPCSCRGARHRDPRHFQPQGVDEHGSQPKSAARIAQHSLGVGGKLHSARRAGCSRYRRMRRLPAWKGPTVTIPPAWAPQALVWRSSATCIPAAPLLGRFLPSLAKSHWQIRRSAQGSRTSPPPRLGAEGCDPACRCRPSRDRRFQGKAAGPSDRASNRRSPGSNHGKGAPKPTMPHPVPDASRVAHGYPRPYS